MRMKNENGFTLIEILIVVLVIGLVGTFAAIAVNSARSKTRDATRLSAVRMTQSALEDYFNETNSYPVSSGVPLGDSTQSVCLGTGGFHASCSGDESVFLRVVTATLDTGLKGASACGTPSRNAYCYASSSDGLGYVIQFELENALPQVGLIKGANCATPEGMKAGACT